jgi:hypothetical protein
MDETSSLMGKDEQDEQHVAGDCRHDKEIQGTSSCTWFFKKVFHVGDEGLRGRTRYVSTIDLATSMPSLYSSPTIRGEPQVGFACHIAWMSSRTSWATAGLDECQGIAPARPQTRQPRPEQTIRRTEVRSGHRPLVDRELMPQRQVFHGQRGA